MHTLTDVGIEAMARELLNIATRGERSWDHEPEDLCAPSS
jgi:hypothetical protein